MLTAERTWDVHWVHAPLHVGGERPPAHTRSCASAAEAAEVVVALRRQCRDDLLVEVVAHEAAAKASQLALPLDLPRQGRVAS